MFAFLQGPELLIVLLIVIVLFGATRLPQLGDALGKGIRNFRKAVSTKEETPVLEEKKENVPVVDKTKEEHKTETKS